MNKCSENEIREQKEFVNSNISSFVTNINIKSIEIDGDIIQQSQWSTKGGIETIRKIKNSIELISFDANKFATCCNQLSEKKVDYNRIYNRTEIL